MTKIVEKTLSILCFFFHQNLQTILGECTLFLFSDILLVATRRMLLNQYDFVEQVFFFLHHF